MHGVALRDLVAAGADTGLGLLGLIVIAGTVALFLGRRPELASRRLALLGALALGAVSYGAGMVQEGQRIRSLRERDTATMVTIDRNNDYHHGVPAWNADGTAWHMMRSSVKAGMWVATGGKPYRVGWLVRAPSAGRWELHVSYATRTSLPAQVLLNDVPVFTALAGTTASSTVPVWRREGTLELQAGMNRLQFYSEEPLPNIDAFRLVKIEGHASGAG